MKKYSIKIYDQNMKELARLENAYDISYDLKLNELWTCSFKLPRDDKKTQYCEIFNFVELFDGEDRVELFRILPQVLTTEETSYIEYECEHVLATLLDDVMFKYHQIGNLGIYTDRVIRYVLDRQTVKRWQLIECDFKRQFEYKWENENLLAALFSIPKPFVDKYKWVFDTTSYPWGISLKKLDTKYKADIQYRKNMTNIEKTVDPTHLVTRVYPLGYGEGDNQLDIKSVNGGRNYLEKNVSKYGLKSTILVDRRFESPETLKEYAQMVLNDLSEPYVSYKLKAVDLSITQPKKYPKFRPGDYVLIRDTEDGINLKVPIVSVSKTDVRGNPFDIDLEIANKSQDITGSISDLMERSRINDTYAQGATNLQQIAYADNADAGHPLTLKFYIPQEMARINKLILNYTIESFRSYSVGLEYKDTKTTSTGSGGGTYKSDSTSSGGGEYGSTGGGGGTYRDTDDEKQVNGRMVSVYVKNRNGIDYSQWVEFYQVQSHSHGFRLPDHTHSISISPHSHSFSIRIPDHSHSVTIPGHTHEQKHGIYEGSRANSCYLKVDGQTVYNYSKEVNIIPYLSKDDGGKIQRGTWHTVEIIPDRLTRINANIFIQLFTNSRGGGDY
ncbi:phage tail protein [Peptoniphilus sp.]|jgi:phage minor structural protein|uniref:phage tail protein n=1 Tax=Peptoniphilus sp. TaxID=1971214 RepID=UPI003D8C7E86